MRAAADGEILYGRLAQREEHMTLLLYRHCRLTVLTIVLLAISLPGNAQANDRDLRATVVHAYSCVEMSLDGTWSLDASPRPGGSYQISGSVFNVAVLYCPLPLNNVDLGGTTNDNDMTEFTVLYKDPDGLGDNHFVQVDLYRAVLEPGGGLAQYVVCSWTSRSNGSASTGWVRARVPCALDLSAVDTYHFSVAFHAGGIVNTDTLGFGGIRFP
jgi:hypothetical protein